MCRTGTIFCPSSDVASSPVHRPVLRSPWLASVSPLGFLVRKFRDRRRSVHPEAVAHASSRHGGRNPPWLGGASRYGGLVKPGAPGSCLWSDLIDRQLRAYRARLTRPIPFTRLRSSVPMATGTVERSGLCHRGPRRQFRLARKPVPTIMLGFPRFADCCLGSTRTENARLINGLLTQSRHDR